MMKVSAGEPLAMMVSAMLLGAEHGIEAGKGDVRGNEEDRHGEGQADGGGQVLSFEAQQPARGRADEQSDGGQRGRQAQRGKRWRR